MKISETFSSENSVTLGELESCQLLYFKCILYTIVIFYFAFLLIYISAKCELTVYIKMQNLYKPFKCLLVYRAEPLCSDMFPPCSYKGNKN